MGTGTDCYEFRIKLIGDEVRCSYDEPGRLNQDLEGRIDRSHLDTILLLEEWLKRWEWIARMSGASTRLLVPDTFTILGNHLWNLAFADGRVGQKIIEARRIVRRVDRDVRPTTIRVRMSFGRDATDLAALPWEFIRFPGPPPQAAFLLATETNLVLDRYLPDLGLVKQAFRPADGRVRVLFVLSLPVEGRYSDERAGVENLRTALLTRGQTEENPTAVPDVVIEADYIDGWNAAEVGRRLAAFKTGPNPGPVDVVHLISLCRLSSAAKTPELYVGGNQRWTEAEGVVEVLTRDGSNLPQLVVLHLCDSDDEVTEHLEQVAPAFIMAGIPAVLAMQYPMQPQNCWSFVQTFYERLAEGKNVGDAVQLARYDLRQNGVEPAQARQFGIPVLFMQSMVDGSLVRRRVASDSGQPRAGVIPSSLPGEQHRATPAPISLKRFLLDELDKIYEESGSTAVDALQEWLDGTHWPEGTDPETLYKVKRAIRFQRRQFANDPEADLMCQRLLQVLRKRFEGTEPA
ncbi:CHAT domain-containing protein [Jatrophihabitans sp.]|uniref:CHAT domain-containing protein n=1 Tax=Jatrophihabitans sp. TaxID=1932789 RepID=UPI002BC754C4|nr:CHAT domain-containing protein [Jatrophihabitans sp.]